MININDEVIVCNRYSTFSHKVGIVQDMAFDVVYSVYFDDMKQSLSFAEGEIQLNSILYRWKEFIDNGKI